jgi:predicted transcriptional regulator of viral defense system
MSLLDTYAVLEGLGPVLTTAEAAQALRRSTSAASHLLGELEAKGRARRLRMGTWAIGNVSPDPYAVVGEFTRPYPAYVSFNSALNYHGMIDQLPREVSVASLDRARRIKTTIATYAVHHLAPELFTAWTDTKRGRIATPEKAVFDLAYVSAVSQGRPRRVPEIELPADFDQRRFDAWMERIRSQRVATLTRQGVEYMLSRAIR